MSKIIWRAECFEAYGLNKFRSFLSEYEVYLDTNEEVFDFVSKCLEAHGCDNSAIFLIDYYDGMWAGIYSGTDDLEVLGRKDFDLNFFATIDSYYRFCCYGLMIETRPGKWKLINA